MENLLPGDAGQKQAAEEPHVHGGGEMNGIDPGLLALMKENGDGNEKSWWLILLILLLGKDSAFGGGNSDRCCQPATLEQLNDAQNAIQNGQVALSNRIGDQTANIIRDIGTSSQQSTDNFARTNETITTASNFNLLGQKDITAAISQCCCDNLLSQKDTQRIVSDSFSNTTRAIEKCCCETQNAIAMQTQVLSQQICQDGDKTRQLITQNKIDELQAQLTDAKLANSNLSQTGILQQSIREACCQPCQPHPYPWWLFQGGNGGPPGPPAAPNMG